MSTQRSTQRTTVTPEPAQENTSLLIICTIINIIYVTMTSYAHVQHAMTTLISTFTVVVFVTLEFRRYSFGGARG